MPGKINILYTIPNFVTAGSQFVLLGILKYLDLDRFQYYVLVEKHPEVFPQVIPKDNRLYLSRTEGMSYVWSLRKLYKKHNIHLVHSWDYRSDAREALAARLSGVAYLYTKKNNSWSKRWKLKSLLSKKITYNNPDMAFRFFGHKLLNKKAVFIPHGVDLQIFTPKDVDKKNKVFTLGCMGVVGPNKNQIFLLNLLTKLPENIVIWFYGKVDDNYLLELTSFVEENHLSNRVVFKAFVPNEEIPNVLATFDIAVLASKQEGLPLSVIEAMACGVPVIASDSGGGTNYLLKNGGGYVIPLEKPEQWIKCITMCYEDTGLRERLGAEGKKIVTANFTIENEVLQYTALYKQLVKNE